jgi:hypothetical protein
MADDRIRATLRLDPGLHARLAKVAGREHRTINGQMIHYIEAGLAEDEDGGES